MTTKPCMSRARCLDSEPAKIVGRLGRRDSQVESDWFLFAVDPYFDKRSGYLFAVNPAGSIMDLTLSNDVNDDSSWDGVWESRAAIVTDGWSVEMKIPFNQIRFAKMDEYVWGVNFRRVIQRKNETATFSWCPEDRTGFRFRFARMEGLRESRPGAHVEITPYVTGQAQFRPAEEGNPFETGHKSAANFGFDAKLGLSSNLTLDASVNPDFGQVEVDPAVVNLSAYETQYDEKRPFFIEGASIFDGFGRGGVYFNANINWPNPTFFYSRRIGRAPQGYVTRDGYTSFPDRSTILGAAKLTGKLGGWNIGFINALTAREFAEYRRRRPALSRKKSSHRPITASSGPRRTSTKAGTASDLCDRRRPGHRRPKRSPASSTGTPSAGRGRLVLPGCRQELGRRRLGRRDPDRGFASRTSSASRIPRSIISSARMRLMSNWTRPRPPSAGGAGGSTLPNRTENRSSSLHAGRSPPASIPTTPASSPEPPTSSTSRSSPASI